MKPQTASCAFNAKAATKKTWWRSHASVADSVRVAVAGG